MADAFEIDPELQARIAAVAASSSRSPAQVIGDALEHGHSLAWQERFVASVCAGLDDAAAGRFATSADFERLRAKYRSS